MGDLPNLKFFYFDRLWLKAYPFFFSNLRIENYRDIYRRYIKDGIFNSMTFNAFTLYRTLDCIRRAIIKQYDLNLLNVEKCREIRKYGEQIYYDFRVEEDTIYVDTFVGTIIFTVDQVKSVRLITYTSIINDRLHYEKSIYIEYKPWLRIMIKPFLENFIPPMIRVFYNSLIRTKEELGINVKGYEAQHSNFIDPKQIDIDKFVKTNHELAFDKEFLISFIQNEWTKWFGRAEDLRIKITQIELAYDINISKLDLINAFQFLGGRTKTIKHSIDTGAFYSWIDSGLKYYITIKKKFQVKTYTKAWSSSKILNRIEFTININDDLENVSAKKVLKNEDLVNVYTSLSKVLMRKDKVESIKKLLKYLIKCRYECEKHYAFWLDILTSGQIKGSSYYRDVVSIYKKEGLIKIKGRGRNSVYTINENLIPFAKKLRELLGITFKELSIPRLTDNQK